MSLERHHPWSWHLLRLLKSSLPLYLGQYCLSRGPYLKIGHYNHAGNCCYLLWHSGHKICGKLYEKCAVLETQSVVLCNRIEHIGLYILAARSSLFNVLLDDKGRSVLDGDGTTHFFAHRWSGRCDFECRQKQEILRVLQNVQTVSQAHPASYAIGNSVIFPG
jgi:hypothetical protein